jgi:hypothetical protein
MSWNYRMIRSEDGGGVCYAIHEVHYDKANKPNGWSEEPASPVSDERSGMLEVLAKMAEAIAQPTLEAQDGKLVEVEPSRVFSDELVKALDAAVS